MEQCLKEDTTISEKTMSSYMHHIEKFMSWLKREKYITTVQVLSFERSDYPLLPTITEYIHSSSTDERISAKTTYVCAYQYLCKVRICFE